MKRLSIVVSVAFVALVTYAFSLKNNSTSPQQQNGNVPWMTFEQAVAATLQDKQEGKKPKLIFIDVFTDWCGWCKKMDKETFETVEISRYLTEHFYPVKLNAEQKEDINFAGHTFKYVQNGNRGYHELSTALGVTSYPTTVYMNSDFQLLQRVPGYLNIQTFDMIMHYLAEGHYNTTPWADYQKKYLEEHPSKD